MLRYVYIYIYNINHATTTRMSINVSNLPMLKYICISALTCERISQSLTSRCIIRSKNIPSVTWGMYISLLSQCKQIGVVIANFKNGVVLPGSGQVARCILLGNGPEVLFQNTRAAAAETFDVRTRLKCCIVKTTTRSKRKHD